MPSDNQADYEIVETLANYSEVSPEASDVQCKWLENGYVIHYNLRLQRRQFGSQNPNILKIVVGMYNKKSTAMKFFPLISILISILIHSECSINREKTKFPLSLV